MCSKQSISLSQLVSAEVAGHMSTSTLITERNCPVHPASGGNGLVEIIKGQQFPGQTMDSSGSHLQAIGMKFCKGSFCSTCNTSPIRELPLGPLPMLAEDRYSLEPHAYHPSFSVIKVQRIMSRSIVSLAKARSRLAWRPNDEEVKKLHKQRAYSSTVDSECPTI